MIVSVWAAGWILDEDRRILRTGQTVSSWLSFSDARMPYVPQERLQTVAGVARTLASWQGCEDGRYPVAISVGAATLYWDAPVPVDGAIKVLGNIWLNNVDAPEDFPVSSGVVRRIRMEWQEPTLPAPDHRLAAQIGAPTHYEDVEVSYLPAWKSDTDGLVPDLGVAGALRWTGCLIDVEVIDTTFE